MSDIRVRRSVAEDRQCWDEYVACRPECTSYHRWAWKTIFEEVFDWPAIYLLAEENGTVRGILPLIQQKCLLRHYLSSMPHLQGGGIVADEPEIENLLFASAVEAAGETNAAYLELRHLRQHDLPVMLRQDKVGSVLPIETDREERLRRFEKRVRHGIRKSLTFGMKAEIGRSELLPEFYEIYHHNMHDLGSPAYSIRFFSEILRQLPNESYICVARKREKEIAAAFMIGFRCTLEVAWASSHREYLHMNPNMFLYWSILDFAAESGYKFLDFGRSSWNSGTFEFKRRWGAVPGRLYWCYWLNHRTAVPEVRSEGMQMASRIWRRLPEAFTDAIGPKLIRHIPGI